MWTGTGCQSDGMRTIRTGIYVGTDFIISATSGILSSSGASRVSLLLSSNFLLKERRKPRMCSHTPKSSDERILHHGYVILIVRARRSFIATQGTRKNAMAL